jgi:membrane associated rhomboid family serine protease
MPTSLACGLHSPWWTCITASFIHANFIHLAINVAVFAMFSFYGYKRYNRVVLIGFAIASLAFFVLRGATPSCGLSGVIFAIYGMLVTRCMRRRDLLLSAVCIAVTFIPPLNGMLHLVCWLVGFAIGYIHEKKVRHH